MRFALCLIAILGGGLASPAAADQPNILFLFADDQSTKTIAALGNPQIKTPNLDRLVRRGATFTNAYNMGSWCGAVCKASRAMIISGRSVWGARAMDALYRRGGGLDETWGRLMSDAGYDTYMTGKWHVMAPVGKVFQQTAHVRGGMPGGGWDHPTMVQRWARVEAGELSREEYLASLPFGYGRPRADGTDDWSPTDQTLSGYWQGGRHWSEVLRDDAVAYLGQAKERDAPFFMYVAFNAPHDPRQAPQEYVDLYDEDELDLPAGMQSVYPEADAIANGPGLRDAALAPFPRTAAATRVHLKEYYAIVSHLDAQVGAILDALEATGKADNTYIIYTADHGLAVGEHGLFGKQTLYDHSARAPFMICGPGIEPGRVVTTDIYLQDAMATALELAGVEKPEHVFFNSILSLAKGETRAGSYDSIYGAYLECQRMIKRDGYKLLVYPDAGRLKLFDLANDPDELRDLSGDPAQADRVRSLFEELLAQQALLGDKLDLQPMFEALAPVVTR